MKSSLTNWLTDRLKNGVKRRKTIEENDGPGGVRKNLRKYVRRRKLIIKIMHEINVKGNEIITNSFYLALGIYFYFIVFFQPPFTEQRFADFSYLISLWTIAEDIKKDMKRNYMTERGTQPDSQPESKSGKARERYTGTQRKIRPLVWLPSCLVLVMRVIKVPTPRHDRWTEKLSPSSSPSPRHTNKKGRRRSEAEMVVALMDRREMVAVRMG